MKNPEKILEEIKNVTTYVLGDNLVGIYVHGSYAFGCFNWDKSDIDYLVVVKCPMALSEKISYISEILRINEKSPSKGIEMSVVLEEYCKNFVYPTPYELHFSNSYLKNAKKDIGAYCETMHGYDPDLAAHFTVINEVGISIFGKEINEVFTQVPREDYIKSIKYDIENAKEDIIKNPVYIVLNLCRVLAYIKENCVLSKKQGGEWGVKNLPEKYYAVVECALQSYSSSDEYPLEMSVEMLEEFAQYMLKEIGL